MFASNVKFRYLCPRCGAICSGWFTLPPPRIWVRQFNQLIIITHNIGIFSCKRYKHYFSQTEMFLSNVQLGYLCPRSGDKLSRLVYLAPPPSIISQFLLHHNIGIFSCKRYKHYFSQTEMFQFGYPCPRGGAICSGWFTLPPPRIWVRQCNLPILITP